MRLACSALLVLAGCSSAAAEPALADVREGAEHYRDVNVAIAEGYTTDESPSRAYAKSAFR